MKSPSLRFIMATGSGKTFTLVKQYLITLLKSKKGALKLLANILNKAVGEMKIVL